VLLHQWYQMDMEFSMEFLTIGNIKLDMVLSFTDCPIEVFGKFFQV
jgi:hypothetical protein